MNLELLTIGAVLTACTEAALKATVLLACGLGLTLLNPKASAALRCWWLTLGLASTPLLFVLSPILPNGDWLASSAHTAPVAFSQAGGMPIYGFAKLTPEAGLLSQLGLDYAGVLLGMWLVGTVFYVAGQLLRAWRLRQVRRFLPLVEAGVLQQALEAIWRLTSLKQCPGLVVSDAWIMPATWGTFRPVIILPKEAESWPAERLENVLWHELGHISRRDSLVDTVGRVATALLWFHPLIWAARRLQADLREVACDDFTLNNAQTDAFRYGHDLLAVTRRHLGLPASPGLAMAQSGSQVGRRLHRLMDAAAKRQAPSSAKVVRLLCGWMAMLGAATSLISCQAPKSAIGAAAVASNLPHGAEVIAYQVTLLENTTRGAWPMFTRNGLVSEAQVASYIAAAMKQRTASVTTYPVVKSLPGHEVVMGSQINQPHVTGVTYDKNGRKSLTVEYEKIGLQMVMNGKISEKGGVDLNFSWDSAYPIGTREVPGVKEKQPIFGKQGLLTEVNLEKVENGVILGGLVNQKHSEQLVIVTARREVNP